MVSQSNIVAFILRKQFKNVLFVCGQSQNLWAKYNLTSFTAKLGKELNYVGLSKSLRHLNKNENYGTR